jgi:hypothetical protein
MINWKCFGRKCLWPDWGTMLPFCGWHQGKSQRTSLRIVDVPAKIWTTCLQNTNLEHRHCTLLLNSYKCTLSMQVLYPFMCFWSCVKKTNTALSLFLYVGMLHLKAKIVEWVETAIARQQHSKNVPISTDADTAIGTLCFLCSLHQGCVTRTNGKTWVESQQWQLKRQIKKFALKTNNTMNNLLKIPVSVTIPSCAFICMGCHIPLKTNTSDICCLSACHAYISATGGSFPSSFQIMEIGHISRMLVLTWRWYCWLCKNILVKE